MDTSRVEAALEAVGRSFKYHCDVEILLVGGAAGMITGLLGAHRTTIDCDVMVCTPPNAIYSLEHTSDKIASNLGLSNHWFNSDVQLRQDTLPDGWRSRRIWVNTFGRLIVYAASRPDLIAMKVIAGRGQDIEDLEMMSIRYDEVEFVQNYLKQLENKGTSKEQIQDGLELLNSLEKNEP